MTWLIESLKARRIVVEPTLNFYHARLGTIVPENVWDSTFDLLVRRLYDAGVTLIAGTDGPPARYLVELQLYERAGIPAAQVLQIATINAARVMNDDAEYGSIAVGKVADLVVVNGGPAERIADLANVEVVRGAEYTTSRYCEPGPIAGSERPGYQSARGNLSARHRVRRIQYHRQDLG
jgi:cytosine/adenosine deaminase-related metal-dependent hydrolase